MTFTNAGVFTHFIDLIMTGKSSRHIILAEVALDHPVDVSLVGLGGLF